MPHPPRVSLKESESQGDSSGFGFGFGFAWPFGDTFGVATEVQQPGQSPSLLQESNGIYDARPEVDCYFKVEGDGEGSDRAPGNIACRLPSPTANSACAQGARHCSKASSNKQPVVPRRCSVSSQGATEKGVTVSSRSTGRQRQPAQQTFQPSQRHSGTSQASTSQAFQAGSVPAGSGPGRRSNASTTNVASKSKKSSAAGKSDSDDNLDEHEKQLLTEVLDRSPGITWDAIAGLTEVKQLFWEIVVAPVKNPALFTGLRSPPRGVLLFGPPGNGKTMLAKAVATECQATFFSISASSLTSKWVGESEKHMRALFSLAIKRQPSIVFIDEIDSILTSRASGEHESSRRLKTEFLVQLDGAATCSNDTPDRVLLLGATNRPGELDDAVLRRFPRRILIPLPDPEARRALMEKSLTDVRHELSKEETVQLSLLSDGYSCSDLAALIREAAMGPVRTLPPELMATATPQSIRSVTLDDFKDALRRVRPSLAPEAMAGLKDWNQRFGGA